MSRHGGGHRQVRTVQKAAIRELEVEPFAERDPRHRSAGHDERVCYRKVRKNARTSRTNNSGCSKAGKWPPFSISLQWVMFVKCGSIQRRTGLMISLGNTATPVGTLTIGVVRRLAKLSQYSRAEEVAVPVTQ